MLNKEGIVYIYFDRATKTVEKKILVNECTPEFDVDIDSNDSIYLVCQKKTGTILLFSFENGVWTKTLVEIQHNSILYNLNILLYNNELHIFYCIPVSEEGKKYTIYHSLYNTDGLKTNRITNITIRQVLNPFQIISTNNKLLFVYYDLINGNEQIFIRIFDDVQNTWEKSIQITQSNTYKLYLDVLSFNGKELHISYCEFRSENLIVKYEKYKLIDTMEVVKITENYLSNPVNCMYPTFVFYDNKLWIVWIEYDNVMSSYSNDMGLNWSNPYLWKESKGVDFARYKFNSNGKDNSNSYWLNYGFSKAYPELTFIGFGSLNKAVEVPLKNKTIKKVKKDENYNFLPNNTIKRIQKKDYIEENYQRIENRIKLLLNRIEKVEENISSLKGLIKDSENIVNEEKLKKIEERVDEIEKYLMRRRRGPFNRPR
jgi:hypothetical protein